MLILAELLCPQWRELASRYGFEAEVKSYAKESLECLQQIRSGSFWYQRQDGVVRIVEFPSKNVILESEIYEGGTDLLNHKALRTDGDGPAQLMEACNCPHTPLKHEIPAAGVMLHETEDRGIGVLSLKVSCQSLYASIVIC